jgi:hypothetical protein
VADADRALAKIDVARKALAEARTVAEVVNLRDQAAALASLFRRYEASRDMAVQAAELRLRCERKLGELLGAAGGPGKSTKSTRNPNGGAPPYTELDISRREVTDFRRLAAPPQELFEQHIEELKRQGDELTRAAMLRFFQHVSKNGTAPAGNSSPASSRPDWRGVPVGEVADVSAAAARVVRLAGLKTAGQLADALDRGGLPTLTAADRAALREGLASLRGYDAPPRPDPGPMGEAERAEFEAEHVHGPLPPSPAEVAAAGRLSGSALTAFVGAVLDAAERLVADLIALRGHYGGGSPEWADVCVLVERLNRVKIDCIRREGSGG